MPGWPARSTTSSFVGSTAIPPAPGGWSSIRELVEELFAGEEAWIVGGAVRDEALDRPIVYVDVAVAAPERAARRYAPASGGPPLPLSERPGALRAALDGRRPGGARWRAGRGARPEVTRPPPCWAFRARPGEGGRSGRGGGVLPPPPCGPARRRTTRRGRSTASVARPSPGRSRRSRSWAH